MDKKSDAINYTTLTALSLINACGAASLLLAPVMVGGLVTTLGFSSQQAGYIISSELAGLALAAIPAALWIRRFNWQHVLYVMLIILLAGNYFTSGLEQYNHYLLIRFVNGFAAGLCLAVSMSVINMTSEPDRSLGFWFSLQLLLTVVGLALLPEFIIKYNVGAVYALLAAFQFLLLIGVRLVPTTGLQIEVGETDNRKPILFLALLGFTSIFLFEAAVMGMWTYYERIGDAAGVSSQGITYALAIGTFVGFLGSLSTAALSTRLGRLIPITFGMGLAVGSILVLRTEFSALIFILSASAFCFAWYFTLPYLMAAIASMDPSGSLLVFVNFITGVGLTLGPAVAAKLQTDDSYEPVIWMGVIALVLAFLLIIRLALLPVESRS